MTFKTEQEEFWAGSFGTEYIDRNKSDSLLASNLNFFSKALRCAHGINSCIEFGANIGMNLRALNLLYPSIDAYGVEINRDAANHLADTIPSSNVFNTSILDFESVIECDLVLIKGVLIHMNPDVLPRVYEKLASASKRYVLFAEYYNPSPVAIPYRGHNDRLFKRDFAGEFMERYPDFRLNDYGFAYRRDPNFPLDDVSWFLMERR